MTTFLDPLPHAPKLLRLITPAQVTEAINRGDKILIDFWLDGELRTANKMETAVLKANAERFLATNKDTGKPASFLYAYQV